MAELLITSSLDPISESDEFPKGKSLPRHVTVWQYFDLPDYRMTEFINNVGNAVQGFSPLEIMGGQYAEFGPNNDVPVRKVIALGSTATLITLHTVLGEVIQRHGATIPNPEWAYEGYNPHITYKDGKALEEAEHAMLGTIELIEKDTERRSKIVRKIWELEDL